MTASRSIVIASAGSGKTYTLANRLIAWMVDRLRREGDPGCDRILASTFTRKAAGEILDRVLEHLAKGAIDPEVCAQYAAGMGLHPEPTPSEFADVLEALVRQLHRVQIGTLDGFFHRIAHCFSAELGLPEHWTIADEYEEQSLRMETLTALLESPDGSFVGELLQMVQQGREQRSVIDVIRDQVWGRSGAVHLYRLTRLRTNPAAPWFWLEPDGDGASLDGGRTLDEKTLDSIAKAMREVDMPVTQKGTERSRYRTAWDRITAAVESEDWEGVLFDSLVRGACFADGRFDRFEVPEPLVELLQPLVAHARTECIGIRHRQLVSSLGLLELLETQYRTIQNRRGLFTFADIAQRLAEAGLVQHGALGNLWFRLDGIVRDIALDEFQDTSRSQFDVLDPIIEEIFGGIGSEEDRGFLVLADPKQSIYAWRGGTSALIGLLEDRHAGQLESAEPLSMSWRSSQVVLDAVDSIFGRLGDNGVFGFESMPTEARDGAVEWAARYESHRAARQLPGFVPVQVPKLPEDVSPRQQHAVDLAVELVVRRQQEDPGRSIGILTSRNDAASRIVTMLRQRGVEASEEGSSALTDSIVVGAVLSLMHLADHPADLRSLFHVSTTPLWDWLERPPLEPSNRSGWRDIATEVSVSMRRRLVVEGYGPCMERIAARLRDACTETDLLRLGHLVELGELWDVRGAGRPSEFVRFVEGSRRNAVTTAPVQVMTIHKSKGLEFDEVVLPELGRDLIRQPSGFFAWSESSIELPERIVPTMPREQRAAWPTIAEECYGSLFREQVQDSLSVLYVAMTRARYALHLVLKPHVAKKDGEPRNILTQEGLVRMGLPDLEDAMQDHREREDTRVWYRGDPEWYRGMPVDAIQTPKVPRSPSPRSGASTRWTVAAAPSEHDRTDGVIESLVDRSDAEFAMLRGTLLHEYMASVRWFEDGPADDAELDIVDRRVSMQIGRPISDELRASGRDAFTNALKHPAVVQRLSRSAYGDDTHDRLEVCNELPFTVAGPDGESNGRIDRLVIGYRDGEPVWAEVVDFKSDAATPQTASEVLARYRRQLEDYRDAVQVLLGLPADRITARLLLTGPGIDVSLN
ncbi:MAG: UvrD-helicase domain-containing protein [Planctomycetota bacterium]|nr:UvrD-helicase domain-containing protein [Planctomycetota bacterium]